MACLFFLVIVSSSRLAGRKRNPNDLCFRLGRAVPIEAGDKIFNFALARACFSGGLIEKEDDVRRLPLQLVLNLEIVPRPPISTSCQRKIDIGGLGICLSSLSPNKILTSSGADFLAEPVNSKRGGRCCKNSSFKGVNSLRIGFCIVSGSLPRKFSSRSTI